MRMHFLGDEWNRELQEKKTKAKRSKKESPLTIKKNLVHDFANI